MATLLSGINFHIHQMGASQTLFLVACNDIANRIQKGQFTQLEAKEAYCKVTNAFQEVLTNIESVKPFLMEGDFLKEGADKHFLQITTLETTVRGNFKKAMTSLHALDPSLPIMADGQEESVSYVHVYYEGTGDLFMRGEGAHIRLPPQASSSLSQRMEIGETKPLSWEEGVPMRREANHLWKAVLVADEKGTAPKYKFLISDCAWSNGQNYSCNATKSIVHVPAFDEMSTSLLVPMDVEFGNKLALVGKGEVIVDNKRIELSWEKGIDFKNLGSKLWVISFKTEGEVAYKICIANEKGDLIWEKGPDRVSIGQELVLTPNFGEGIGRVESMEKASSNLGLHLLDQQDLVKEQVNVNRKQKKAEIVRRANPDNHDGKGFPDKAVIKVNGFVRIEDKEIDGTHFQFHYTRNNKVIIMQGNLNGCTAGASAMLIVDNGKTPRAADLVNRQGANYTEVAQDIKNAGLEPLIVPVATYGRSLQKLKEQIEKHGPAYIRIKEPCGTSGHAILIDEISTDLTRVRIRDTGHAWEIILGGETFKDAWYGSMDEKLCAVGNQTMETWDHTVQVKGGVK